jgi:hypothetical protein
MTRALGSAACSATTASAVFVGCPASLIRFLAAVYSRYSKLKAKLKTVVYILVSSAETRRFEPGAYTRPHLCST